MFWQVLAVRVRAGGLCVLCVRMRFSCNNTVVSFLPGREVELLAAPTMHLLMWMRALCLLEPTSLPSSRSPLDNTSIQPASRLAPCCCWPALRYRASSVPLAAATKELRVLYPLSAPKLPHRGPTQTPSRHRMDHATLPTILPPFTLPPLAPSPGLQPSCRRFMLPLRYH